MSLIFTEQNNDGSKKLKGDDFIKLYESFVNEYPILSIEDPFDQDDWAHYTKINEIMGDKVQIVGDDLLVTNPKVHPFALPFSFSTKPSLGHAECAYSRL